VDAQKKTLHASERDPVKRAAFREAIAAYRPADLVFVDETGATTRLTRTHARAPRGERAVGSVPRNHHRATTLVAALTPTGLQAAHHQPAAMTAAGMITYVRDVLCPVLRRGQVVVLDNLSVHKHATIRELIEAVGCSLVFLPPYSPDFAPIELAYAKLKAALRAAGARTQAALDQALDVAVATITAQDARGFFRHCGYSLAQSVCNPL
jgi:hypothetical protein